MDVHTQERLSLQIRNLLHLLRTAHAAPRNRSRSEKGMERITRPIQLHACNRNRNERGNGISEMSERYRLALIAHHAEELAEMVREQGELSYEDYSHISIPHISVSRLQAASEYINKHLNEEETK